jgi:drug/metabolite transporter (DMT)-like permease
VEGRSALIETPAQRAANVPVDAAPITPIASLAAPRAPAKSALVNILLLATLVTIGGITPSAARIAMIEMPMFSTGFVRFSIAALLLVLTQRLWTRDDPRARAPIERRDCPRILLCGLLCVPLNQAFFLSGVKMTNAAHPGLLYALNPVLVYLFTLIAGSAQPSRRMAVATILAFAGAGVVFLDGCLVGYCETFVIGDVLLLLAVGTWAGYSVLIGPLGQKYGPVRVLTLMMVIGSIMYAPVLMIDGAELLSRHISWRAIAGFAFITLFTAYLNYVLWFIGLMRIGVNRLAVAMNAAPLLSIIVAHQLCGDALTRWLLTGTALLLVGITLANWDRLRAILRREARTS